jgi:hypothetical protein
MLARVADDDGEVGPLALNALARGRVTVLGTYKLAAEACTSVEQLVHHLMLLEHQVQRGEKAASRRAP